jgi:hypothetical protein
MRKKLDELRWACVYFSRIFGAWISVFSYKIVNFINPD